MFFGSRSLTTVSTILRSDAFRASIPATIIATITSFSFQVFTPEIRNFFGLETISAPDVAIPSDVRFLEPGELYSFPVNYVGAEKSDNVECSIESKIDLVGLRVGLTPDCATLNIDVPSHMLKNNNDEIISGSGRYISGDLELKIEDIDGPFTGVYHAQFSINAVLEAKLALPRSVLRRGEVVRVAYTLGSIDIPEGYNCIWSMHSGLRALPAKTGACAREIEAVNRTGYKDTGSFYVAMLDRNGQVVSNENVTFLLAD